MQHIGIDLQDEFGQVQETYDLNFAPIIKLLWQSSLDEDGIKKSFPWLASVDPYGDTIFNHLQITNLINELIVFSSQIKDTDTGVVIAEIIKLLTNRRIQEMGLYVKFVGD